MVVGVMLLLKPACCLPLPQAHTWAVGMLASGPEKSLVQRGQHRLMGEKSLLHWFHEEVEAPSWPAHQSAGVFMVVGLGWEMTMILHP